MPNILPDRAIEQYHRDGYYFPLKVLDDQEITTSRNQLEAFETAQGKSLQGAQRNKSHLLFKWVDDLMRHDKILDAVEALTGPDLLCWNTLFWIKEPQSESFVTWHQDLRYWGLDTDDLVSVWLALSPATLASGCMHVLPGSHQGELLPHKDEYAEGNLLTRGQEIAVEVDEALTVAMPLAPGELSLHNGRLAHASSPNQSADRRIGLSLHYMPPRTKQVVGEWDSAALVRGEDRFGHFNHAPQPTKNFDPVAVEFHQQATDAVREILFTDAEKVRPTI
ncbi:MAG: phytanoyl-CoA dioxygenase family protein [Candidatus Latescibacterota bacterium]|nr:phytanoyl-CoA dioxygenase family protein [Candidatus Latescibacterota bacterium]